MPAGQFLSATERQRLEGFPNVIEPEDLAAFYTLTDDDLVVMQRRGRDPGSRLAFAVTVCALRHLNFVPARVELAPTEAVRFVAEQLGCRPILDGYVVHERTRRAHALNAIRHGGLRRAS